MESANANAHTDDMAAAAGRVDSDANVGRSDHHTDSMAAPRATAAVEHLAQTASAASASSAKTFKHFTKEETAFLRFFCAGEKAETLTNEMCSDVARFLERKKLQEMEQALSDAAAVASRAAYADSLFAEGVQLCADQIVRRKDNPLGFGADGMVDVVPDARDILQSGDFRKPAAADLAPLLEYASKLTGTEICAFEPLTEHHYSSVKNRLLVVLNKTRTFAGELMRLFVNRDGKCLCVDDEIANLLFHFYAGGFGADSAVQVISERGHPRSAAYVATTMTADSRCKMRTCSPMAIQGIYCLPNRLTGADEWWGMTARGIRIADTKDAWLEEQVLIHENLRKSLDDAAETVIDNHFGGTPPREIFSATVYTMHVTALGFTGDILPVCM